MQFASTLFKAVFLVGVSLPFSSTPLSAKPGLFCGPRPYRCNDREGCFINNVKQPCALEGGGAGLQVMAFRQGQFEINYKDDRGKKAWVVYGKNREFNADAILYDDDGCMVMNLDDGVVVKYPYKAGSCSADKVHKYLGSAMVDDPPSNIRATPNGKILCSVTVKDQRIPILEKDGEWFKTDYCGSTGYIHQNQVLFSFSPY
ncbi:hypothetical protein MITS9509_00994 [Synechococcus sp. MIT S9509]|uniref:hypothetical protein n=1 Tax=Synechococcus sp. MIT S9509 TaxID=1801630 RepID=UPI0007BC3C47|nr:hypothetical protein [Synechococcus sp. MIT S9509]KZR93117.1 hypothetical protein MITS9509_00994 [Synechococcus sp. MIT S9509]